MSTFKSREEYGKWKKGKADEIKEEKPAVTILDSSSMPAPTDTQRKKNSFARQAAKASWKVALLNLGVMAFGNSVLKSSISSMTVLILGNMVILFFIIGFILGIIGLLGAKRREAKSTAVPATIGILLNGGLLLLLMLIIVASYQKARIRGNLAGGFESGGYELISEEGHFSIMMPGKPLQNIERVQTQLATIEVHFFAIEYDNIAYVVTYSDYPQDYVEHVDIKDLLDQSRDGFVSSVKGRLLSDKYISYEGYPGIESMIESQDANAILLSRRYIVDSRLYQLIVIGSKENTSPDSFSSFFDSFTLL